MKPQKGMQWVVSVELEDGRHVYDETQDHVGKHTTFLKKYSKIIYGSKVARIIERYQEPIKEGGE